MTPRAAIRPDQDDAGSAEVGVVPAIVAVDASYEFVGSMRQYL